MTEMPDELINLKEALKLLDGDVGLLKELLNSFLNDKIFDLNYLIELESNGKLDEAASYIHYFKGAGRQLACTNLATTGQMLEDVLRGKKEGDLSDLNIKFSTSYTLTYNKIQDIVKIL